MRNQHGRAHRLLALPDWSARQRVSPWVRSSPGRSATLRSCRPVSSRPRLRPRRPHHGPRLRPPLALQRARCEKKMQRRGAAASSADADSGSRACCAAAAAPRQARRHSPSGQCHRSCPCARDCEGCPQAHARPHWKAQRLAARPRRPRARRWRALPRPAQRSGCCCGLPSPALSQHQEQRGWTSSRRATCRSLECRPARRRCCRCCCWPQTRRTPRPGTRPRRRARKRRRRRHCRVHLGLKRSSEVREDRKRSAAGLAAAAAALVRHSPAWPGASEPDADCSICAATARAWKLGRDREASASLVAMRFDVQCAKGRWVR
jgi:hypothetical protein